MNKVVILTRTENQNQALISKFSNLDIHLISCPLYSVEKVIPKLESEQLFNWCFITSQNSVYPESLELIKNLKIACIGKKTAKLIEDLGYKVSFIPKKETEENFIEEFISIYKNTDLKVLLFQGNTSSDFLSNSLQSLGVNFEKKLTYNVVESITTNTDLTELTSISNTILYVSLYSVNAAQIFLKDNGLYSKLKTLNLDQHNIKLKLLTIGIKTEKYLKGCTELEIINHEVPDIEESLLGLVD